MSTAARPLQQPAISLLQMASGKDFHNWTNSEVEALVRHIATFNRQAPSTAKRLTYTDALREFSDAQGIPFKAVENKWGNAKREFLTAHVNLPSGAATPSRHPYHDEWIDALGSKAQAPERSVSSPCPAGVSAGMAMSTSSQYSLSQYQPIAEHSSKRLRYKNRSPKESAVSGPLLIEMLRGLNDVRDKMDAFKDEMHALRSRVNYLENLLASNRS